MQQLTGDSNSSTKRDNKASPHDKLLPTSLQVDGLNPGTQEVSGVTGGSPAFCFVFFLFFSKGNEQHVGHVDL